MGWKPSFSFRSPQNIVEMLGCRSNSTLVMDVPVDVIIAVQTSLYLIFFGLEARGGTKLAPDFGEPTMKPNLHAGQATTGWRNSA